MDRSRGIPYRLRQCRRRRLIASCGLRPCLVRPRTRSRGQPGRPPAMAAANSPGGLGLAKSLTTLQAGRCSRIRQRGTMAASRMAFSAHATAGETVTARGPTRRADAHSGGGGGRSPPPPLWCARHAVLLGGTSPLRAVMTGTARLGKGVCQEAESEGSRCCKLGFEHVALEVYRP
jgi:hypothetical protein